MIVGVVLCVLCLFSFEYSKYVFAFWCYEGIVTQAVEKVIDWVVFWYTANIHMNKAAAYITWKDYFYYI